MHLVMHFWFEPRIMRYTIQRHIVQFNTHHQEIWSKLGFEHPYIQNDTAYIRANVPITIFIVGIVVWIVRRSEQTSFRSIKSSGGATGYNIRRIAGGSQVDHQFILSSSLIEKANTYELGKINDFKIVTHHLQGEALSRCHRLVKHKTRTNRNEMHTNHPSKQHVYQITKLCFRYLRQSTL